MVPFPSFHMSQSSLGVKMFSILLPLFFLFNSIRGELDPSLVEEWAKGRNLSEVLVDPAMTVISLINVVKAELQIYDLLKNYGKEKESKKLERYLLDFESVSGRELANFPQRHLWLQATHLAKNPNTVLRTLGRMVRLLRPILRELADNGETEIIEEISKKYEDVEPPTEDEYLEQIEMMLHSHAFYDLDPIETANGKYLQMQTASILNPSHLLDIAEFALSRKMYNQGYYFFLAALKINEERPDDSFDPERARKGLNELIGKHNVDILNLGSLDSREEDCFSDKLSFNLSDPVPQKMYLENIKKYAGKKELMEGRWGYEGNGAYYTHRALCNGADFSDKKKEKDLFCYRDSSSHPFFILCPVKVEVRSRDPLFLYYHQVFPLSWIRNAWEEVAPVSLNPKFRKPTLEYLTINSRNLEQMRDTLLPVVDPRQNVSYKMRAVPFKCYLNDSMRTEHPIEKRIEMITGLQLLNGGSEDYLHINSHLMGMKTVLHQDYLSVEQKDSDVYWHFGWRMNTFLMFLTEAELGGGIAFTVLGQYFKPAVGDGIFWSVATTEGTSEYRTSHDGCPSIIGHRFVGLRFIRSRKNYLNRKCSTNKRYWLDPLAKLV